MIRGLAGKIFFKILHRRIDGILTDHDPGFPALLINQLGVDHVIENLALEMGHHGFIDFLSGPFDIAADHFHFGIEILT